VQTAAYSLQDNMIRVGFFRHIDGPFRPGCSILPTR
jgi:hypothetical protein